MWYGESLWDIAGIIFFVRQMLQVTKQQQQLSVEYFSFDLTWKDHFNQIAAESRWLPLRDGKVTKAWEGGWAAKQEGTLRLV